MAELSPAELKYLVARQREELKTIGDVGKILRLTGDSHGMIRSVATYLRQAFPIALCGILLVEPRKLHLVRFAPISQADMKNLTQQIVRDTNEKTKLSLKEGDVLLQVDDDPSGTGAWAQAPMGFLRSHVSVPLAFEGQVVGVLSVFSRQNDSMTQEDIHTLETVADQLRAALRNTLLVEKLRLADQLKNDLLAIISHELRIPLTVIQEGVGLLSDGSLGAINADQQDFLKTVNQNVDRLRLLLDKVLVATQALTGNLKCTFAPMEVEMLLAEVEKSHRPIAEAKQVKLEFDKPASKTAWAMDAAKLSMGLGELIENAIQAARAEGKVSVHFTKHGHAIEFQIVDTGPGIPEKDLPHLFESFHSIGGIHDRKTGGLGLGLFIAKALVDAHGGTLRVESKLQEGTRMIIELPQRPA